MSHERQCIGLIGTGALGSAVARRLIELDLEVHAYNRDPRKLAPLAELGVVPCASPAQVAEKAAIVLTAVTDSAALEAVLYGSGGVLRERRRPLLIVDIGTHDPDQLAAVARKAIASGAAFLEAPVTGSVHDAIHGTLNFLAGGDEATVCAARPFLETLGKRVYHMGPPGSGNTAKLAMNLLVGAMAFGLGEAIAMLDSARLEVPVFLDALAASGLKSPLYDRLGQRYLERDFAVRFSLSNLEKDLAWARKHALDRGAAPWLSARMAELLGEIGPDVKAQDYSVLLAHCEGWTA